MVVQLSGAAPTEAPPAAYLLFSAAIDAASTARLIEMLAACANQGIPEVHLLISTPGGSVDDGITIYNVLRGMPFKLIVHNVGNVDSIGNVVFLAGDERYACVQSRFLMHGVFFNGGNETFDRGRALETLDGLRAYEDRIAEIIMDRTRLDAHEVGELHKGATTMNPDQALRAGIVHGVRGVEIPPHAAVLPVVLPRVA